MDNTHFPDTNCTITSLRPASVENFLTGTDDLEKFNSDLFQKLLPSIIFFTIFICVGIPGNLLVLLVYVKKFKASATRVFVLAMAVCDFFVSLVTIPVTIIYFRLMYTISSPIFCPVRYFLVNFPVVLSCLVLVCASMHRRRRVCQPLRRQLTSHEATFILVLPFFLTVLPTLAFSTFQDRIKFTAETGLLVTKCSFRSELPGNIFKRLQGGVYAMYGIVGLALVVGAYSHILYRVKQQSQRKHHRIANDVRKTDPATLAISSTVEERCGVTSQPDVVNNENGESYDHENRNELKEYDQKVIYSPKSKGKRSRNVVQPSGRRLSSKTTLVMFVLTVTNAVCLLPYIIMIQFHETYFKPDTSAWILNLSVTFSYLPSLRSTFIPFIHFYFNPKFHSHCLYFLGKMLNCCIL